jgi:hypothetical protein
MLEPPPVEAARFTPGMQVRMPSAAGAPPPPPEPAKQREPQSSPAPAPVRIAQPPDVVGATAIRQVVPGVPESVRTSPAFRSLGPIEIAVRVVVDTEGKVSQATVESLSIRHNFSEFLAGFAVNAARQWRFRPATVNGKPVPGSAVLRFRLMPSQR